MADAIFIPENPMLMAIKILKQLKATETTRQNLLIELQKVTLASNKLTTELLADISSAELDGSEDPIVIADSLLKQIQAVEETSQKLQVTLQALEKNKLNLMEIHTKIITSIGNAMHRFERNHFLAEGNLHRRYKMMHTALATIEDGSIIDVIEKKVYANKLREALLSLSIIIKKAKGTFEQQMLPISQEKSITARLSMLKGYIVREQEHFKKFIAEQTHVAVSPSTTPPLIDSRPPL